MSANSRYLQLPTFGCNSNTGFQTLGNNAADVLPSQSAQVYGNEVVYIGNHGVHLPVAVTPLNGLPRQYLSTSPDRDQTLINTLTTLGLAASTVTSDLDLHHYVSGKQQLSPDRNSPDLAQASLDLQQHQEASGTSWRLFHLPPEHVSSGYLRRHHIPLGEPVLQRFRPVRGR